MDSLEIRRTPYTGSCHCGFTKYVAFLTLPPKGALDDKTTNVPHVDENRRHTRFYKCNCTTCHKMGLFHLRLPNVPEDFYLLSPLAPENELGDYQCGPKYSHWYFCPKCGVRCFSVWMKTAKAYIDHLDLDALKQTGSAELASSSNNPKTPVWRIPSGDFEETTTGYLSINAVTIDHDQPGFDLRALADKKWIQWIDRKDDKEDARYDYPQEGGIW